MENLAYWIKKTKHLEKPFKTVGTYKFYSYYSVVICKRFVGDEICEIIFGNIINTLYKGAGLTLDNNTYFTYHRYDGPSHFTKKGEHHYRDGIFQGKNKIDIKAQMKRTFG